jgi:phage-related protein
MPDPQPFWSWCPAAGMQKGSKLNVDTQGYGDGYVHRATRGLHPVRPNWSLTFPFKSADEAQAMTDFLEANAAAGFYTKLPGEADYSLVVCDEWSLSFVDRTGNGTLAGNLSATFAKSFNPQPIGLGV